MDPSLLAQVDRAFEVTGAQTPGWPDPHPDRDPLEEEYSRCLDPGKYRILQSRIEAWVSVLVSLGMARVDDVDPGPWIGAVRGVDRLRRVRRLTPTREGGLSVLLGETLVDGEPFGVDIGLSDSAVFLDTIPDCGCDACDSGSDDLLEVLDEWILTVARGGVVHARSGDESASRTLDGWQASGSGFDPERWLDGSAPAPDGVRRWLGDPWR